MRSRIVAQGMLRVCTPIEDYTKEYGLYVKREDKSCVSPGPAFSKTRGVYEHVRKRPESLIGVLDTYHSQAGHAVARACQILDKSCVNFYPEYKYEPGYRLPQERALELGATLRGLTAGRSCILYHRAKKQIEERGGYMMPNALKLEESIEETAKEVVASGIEPKQFEYVVVPASSATIAAGVLRGFSRLGRVPEFIVHLGYKRSREQVIRYVFDKAGGRVETTLTVVDEGYSYKDKARDGETPPWPCNEYYDLKAFRWFLSFRDRFNGAPTLFWNIG